MRVAALLLVLSCARSVAADAASRPDIVTALGTRSDARSQAHACEATMKDAGWQFRFAEYFWEGGSLAAWREADLVVESLSAAERRTLGADIEAFADASATSRKRASLLSLGATDVPSCKAFFNRIVDDHRDSAGPFSAATGRLEAAYASRLGGIEAVRRESRHQDLVMGCMKADLKKGARDFDKLRSRCTCTIDAFESSMTPKELDDFVRSNSQSTVAQTEETLMRQPWYKTAQPKAQACMESVR